MSSHLRCNLRNPPSSCVLSLVNGRSVRVRNFFGLERQFRLKYWISHEKKIADTLCKKISHHQCPTNNNIHTGKISNHGLAELSMRCKVRTVLFKKKTNSDRYVKVTLTPLLRTKCRSSTVPAKRKRIRSYFNTRAPSRVKK